MKRFWAAVRGAWQETRARWSGGTYVTLDCRDGNHTACEVCYCPCHEVTP